MPISFPLSREPGQAKTGALLIRVTLLFISTGALLEISLPQFCAASLSVSVSMVSAVWIGFIIIRIYTSLGSVWAGANVSIVLDLLVGLVG